MHGMPPPHMEQQYMGGQPPPHSSPSDSSRLSEPQSISDPSAENGSASKPKKARTLKKAVKDGMPAVRGKNSKGRGRGRGGFMIDNLLHSVGGKPGDDDCDESAEIKDIASYVANDEYFKQQTSS